MVKGQLRGHRDFRLLWAGETVSELGSQVSLLAIPLLAVRTLHATTFQVGLLTAAETAAFLIVGLPAGVWVDRIRRHWVMIAADLGRVLALGSIPVAYALDALTMVQLIVVTLATGILTVFFDVAYQSYLPSLVGREHLVEGNAKLTGSAAGGRRRGTEHRRWTGPGHRELVRRGGRLHQFLGLSAGGRRHSHARTRAGGARGRTSKSPSRHGRRTPIRVFQPAPPCHCLHHSELQPGERGRGCGRGGLPRSHGACISSGDRAPLHPRRTRRRARGPHRPDHWPDGSEAPEPRSWASSRTSGRC